MPYKCRNIKIPDGKKASQKLTQEQKEEIYKRYNIDGDVSQRQLAREYGVSRRLITFIIDPKKHEENLQRRKEAGGSKKYYDKDKHKEAIKKHRRRKQELYLNGELEE
jgi:transposase-like protein